MQLIRIILAFVALSLSTKCLAQSDSVQIDTTQKVGIDSLLSNGKTVQTISWYESKSMPWIASIFIGILTVIANLIISHYTRSTSLKVVKAQIESSTKLASIQFQATLNSKNRQDWINDVRNAISEYATHVRQLNIQLQEKDKDRAAIISLHQNVYLHKSKIKMLLSPKIREHAYFLDAQENLMDVLEDHLLKSKGDYGEYNNQSFIANLNVMVEKGRELLYFEWQKIQNAVPMESKADDGLRKRSN
jgi:hypothetical protein